MRFSVLWIVVLLLAAPAPLLAQRGAEGDGRPSVRQRHGPVEKLLRNRGVLQLTDAQVVELEQINRLMEEQNRPYVQQLLGIRKAVHARLEAEANLSREERRELVRQSFRDAEPLIERIKENNRAAMESVGAVLTPEQRSLLRKMIRKDGRSDGRSGDAPRGRARDH